MSNGAGSPARILVVDDEASIVDSVATVLRYEGFDVDVASTGRAALHKAQEDLFDLVVLDVMLPDLDGLEVTRRIRETAWTSRSCSLRQRARWKTASQD